MSVNRDLFSFILYTCKIKRNRDITALCFYPSPGWILPINEIGLSIAAAAVGPSSNKCIYETWGLGNVWPLCSKFVQRQEDYRCFKTLQITGKEREFGINFKLYFMWSIHLCWLNKWVDKLKWIRLGKRRWVFMLSNLKARNILKNWISICFLKEKNLKDNRNQITVDNPVKLKEKFSMS